MKPKSQTNQPNLPVSKLQQDQTSPSAAKPQSFQAQKQPSSPQQKLTSLVFGILLCIWAGVATVGAQFIVAIPMSKILGARLAEPVWTTVYTALTYIIALIITIFVPKFLYKELHRYDKHKPLKRPQSKKQSFESTREELGLKSLPTFTDIGLAPVFFIGYFILAWLFTFAMTAFFPWFDSGQAQDVGFNFLNSGLDRFVAFIALVICAPIAEEIIFRGWLYGKLRARLGIFISILFTSLLFGLLHGQWNVGVNVFAMSIILCLQRETTGTIYSGILLHMLKNGLAFYLLYIIGMH